MCNRDKWLFGLCITLGVLGLLGKITDSQKRSVPENTVVLFKLEQAVFKTGLVKGSTQKLTMEESYQALVYRSTKCEGALIVVPLPRNAEGAGLLKRVLRSPPKSLFFILQGEKYEQFPSFNFWLEGVRHGLSSLGQEREEPRPIVFAIAELGLCNLAPNIDWSTSGPTFAKSAH